MSGAARFGTDGLEVTAPQHLCAFYRGESERDELLVPYLQAGLATGDCCICVIDSSDPDAVRSAVSADLAAPAATGEQHLEVLSPEESYFRTGAFSPRDMLAFWDERVGSLLERTGAPRVRWAGEMTWALRDVAGVERVMELEAELNRFIVRYPQVILCLYDLNRFSGDVIVDILKTHPRVVFGTMIVENPYFEAPEPTPHPR